MEVLEAGSFIAESAAIRTWERRHPRACYRLERRLAPASGGSLMKAGLVGYAQSGKTTIFNALTGLHKAGTPAARGHVNLGAIKVPDPRVDALSKIFKPRKTTFA